MAGLLTYLSLRTPSHKAGRFTVALCAGFNENYSSGYCYRFARYSLLYTHSEHIPFRLQRYTLFFDVDLACLNFPQHFFDAPESGYVERRFI